MVDYDILKKKYGENFAKLCRELFPTIMEKPGVLSNIILEHFNPSRFLYNDIIINDLINDFKNYVYSIIDKEIKKKTINTNISAKELLKSVGYTLYECHTESDIQKFKKYFHSGEELCTFNGGRLDNCYVFFAVKDNASSLNREDYTNPKRQDEYGTSVISIQISKDKTNTLSIKNRYNHTVSNPDATYSNNLDNIVPGLTKAFNRDYNLNINKNNCSDFEMPDYVVANDGKYYKYNYEIDNIYYCPDNIIIDNFKVKKFDKEKYIVLDYFILDLQNKKIYCNIRDSFIDAFNDIKKIEIINNKEKQEKIIKVICNDETEFIIVLNNLNQIISYKNTNIKDIGDNFLHYNKCLTKIYLPKVERIDDSFLDNNEYLLNINLPKVESIGNHFLYNNNQITSINLLNLKSVGDKFLRYNNQLTNINLPNVISVGDQFLKNNNQLTNINLPNLESVGDAFLLFNEKLTYIDLPNVISIGSYFLEYNNQLTNINLPNVISVGDQFLKNNNQLTNINLPNLESVGDAFLLFNKKLTYINLPNIKYIGDYFLHYNNYLTKLELPNVKYIGDYFLCYNKKLTYINLPNVKNIGYGFLYNNENIKVDKTKKLCKKYNS